MAGHPPRHFPIVSARKPPRYYFWKVKVGFIRYNQNPKCSFTQQHVSMHVENIGLFVEQAHFFSFLVPAQHFILTVILKNSGFFLNYSIGLMAFFS